MKKFKKGDLVRVYGNVGTGTRKNPLPARSEDYYSSEGWIGRVLSRYCDTEMTVRLTKSFVAKAGCEVTVHPKQCRYFKPKGVK